jgi:Tol biopolymer transport system component
VADARCSNNPQESAGNTPGAGADLASIQAQLERILAAGTFATAESLRRFLRFVVERALQGRSGELKEYVLGVEVFDRGEQFDPRLDSIVRVQGRKLRAKLDEYYLGPGKDDPIRIELPKGSYVALIRSRQHQDAGTAAPSAPSVSDSPAVPVPSWASRRKRRLGFAFGFLAVLAGFYAVVHRAGPTAVGPQLTRLTYDDGLTIDPAISPDGKLVAYASDRDGKGNLNIWVQQTTPGQPLRLTSNAVDREPAFSPDGSRIVFTSDLDGGGIYVVPVLGGVPRKVAPKGRRPRFSPDGSQIVYWVGWIFGQVYVVPATGGSARQIQPEFELASNPAWSPDGKSLLFWGNHSRTAIDWDWWVAPLGGGPAVKTGLWSALARYQVEPDVQAPGDWIWVKDHVLLSARQRDNTSIWSIPISPKTWQATGSPQRLTIGSGQDTMPSLSADGRLVFASISTHTSIWSLPAKVNEGQVTGELRQLTSDLASNYWPLISPDGTKLVFGSKREGNWDLWFKDLQTDKQFALTAPPRNATDPILSADGSRVAFVPYFQQPGQLVPLYVIALNGGPPQKVCDHCGYPSDWSHDGSKIFFHLLPRGNPSWLDLANGQKHAFLSHPLYFLCQVRLSPDDHWAAFQAVTRSTSSRLYIVRFPEGAGTDQDKWIPTTEDAGWQYAHQWSPDGNLLYYLSDRDGFVCIWAQPLEAGTRRPHGGPLPVYHFHDTRRTLRNMRPSWVYLGVASDQLVFNLEETTGNIWMTQLPL